ncbi:MAG: GatB/YqeY domain-containing protein [Gammaproteobacteria bacterium]|nr:GatB/YqeY domain-containing protein [Gammaproteobacteria bacterium]
MSGLKSRINEDIKSAMRAKDRARLGVLRLILAAIKQREVDERTELDDARVLAVLDRLARQHRDSIDQFEKAGRTDLSTKERFELEVVRSYQPQRLSDDALAKLIDESVREAGASSVRDMGKVMSLLRDKIQGRADMAQVGNIVKARLS